MRVGGMRVGGVLVVDKPSGISSHRVVSVARKALGTRDVGHAGTLDPAATGVLVLGVSEGLKLLRYLVVDDKRYAATVALGTETTTLDAEGEVVRTAPVPEPLTLEGVRAAAAQFVGPLSQRVPDVSAIKQGGMALYKRVRRGETIEAPERQVVVHSLDIDAVREGKVELRVHSGKGFYVRSLARDLAIGLGTVGHLSALRRLQSGDYDLTRALPFDVLQHAAGADDECRRAAWAAIIEPLDVLPNAPRVRLTDEGVAHARNGRVVLAGHTCEGSLPEGALEPILMLDPGGTLIALGRRDGDLLRVVRGIRAGRAAS
jgi:tRNA pseudouridine55 synthase